MTTFVCCSCNCLVTEAISSLCITCSYIQPLGSWVSSSSFINVWHPTENNGKLMFNRKTFYLCVYVSPWAWPSLDMFQACIHGEVIQVWLLQKQCQKRTQTKTESKSRQYLDYVCIGGFWQAHTCANNYSSSNWTWVSSKPHSFSSDLQNFRW